MRPSAAHKTKARAKQARPWRSSLSSAGSFLDRLLPEREQSPGYSRSAPLAASSYCSLVLFFRRAFFTTCYLTWPITQKSGTLG
jgi:hypothetical protein